MRVTPLVDGFGKIYLFGPYEVTQSQHFQSVRDFLTRRPVFDQLVRSGTPFVLIDRRFPGLKANYVGVDDTELGKVATEHLIACGCRRIAHLRGPEVSTGTGRLRGYEQTLQRHRLAVSPQYVLELKAGDDRSEEHGFGAMQRVLALDSPPDGVFCYNDEVAIGALRALWQAGVDVPSEIALIGVDNIRYADLLRVPLSSIDQKSYLIGERCAKLALDLIEAKRTVASREIILPVELVARQSTLGHQKPGRS